MASRDVQFDETKLYKDEQTIEPESTLEIARKSVSNHS